MKRCGNWIICIGTNGFAPGGLAAQAGIEQKRLSNRDLAGTLELDAGETFRPICVRLGFEAACSLFLLKSHVNKYVDRF